jgi:hypothetical protein
VALAADFGWKTLSKGQKSDIKAGLDSASDKVKGRNYRTAGGGGFWQIGDFEVLIHKIKGNEWHMHLENEKLKESSLGTKKEYEAHQKSGHGK